MIGGLGWTPPEDSTEPTVPSTEPPPDQQPDFWGTGLPMEYGYAIVIVIIVAIAVLLLYFKKRGNGSS